MSRKLDSYRYTNVTVNKSRDDIEKLLHRVGARGFRWESQLPPTTGLDNLDALLDYEGKLRGFRLTVIWQTDRERTQKFRALYWYLKAKIEAIEFGLVELEREFLSYLLTPSGRTVYDEIGGAETKLLQTGGESGQPSR